MNKLPHETNSMNHVEYKKRLQERFETEFVTSPKHPTSLLKFGEWFLSILQNILTCALQSMDEEMSKLAALKIIQTYTQLMKRQS